MFITEAKNLYLTESDEEIYGMLSSSSLRGHEVTYTIDNRGKGWTGNARTVRVPVCINHPILYIWDFWKVYYCILRGTFQPIIPYTLIIKILHNNYTKLYCKMHTKYIVA